MTAIKLTKLPLLFSVGAMCPASRFYIFVFSIQLMVNTIADDWIQTAHFSGVGSNSLRHDHCPKQPLLISLPKKMLPLR